jgi:signal transduction histidine kinase
MLEPDRVGVRALYAMLSDLDATLRGEPAAADSPASAGALADGFDLDRALAFARGLGVSSRGADVPLADDVRQTIHDLRGGALTSLLIEVSRARMRRGTGGARALKILTSDHLKVMRNAVLELDDARRTADLAPNPHPVERLAETLTRVTGDGAHGPVRVDVRCSFEGSITMSCVELGALDRAALNLVNNAVRHTASGGVNVALVPSSVDPRPDLCVCVVNAIDAGHAAALRSRFGDDLGAMFLESFSTTGSGDGLKICVDFVSAAYGLVRREEVVRSGLVGAVVDEGWFVAWLHWPSVA